MRSTHDEVDLELVVREKSSPAQGVIGLTLAAPTGTALPLWEPGAHVDLLAPNGVVRQYSLCGDPDDRSTWRLGVLLETDGLGSAFVRDQLAVGSTVSVRGPRNHFALVPAPRYVFVAGGIGITPIIPMLRAAERADADWLLAYGGRTRGSMAFVDELVATYGSKVRVQPQDEVGLLDLAALLAAPDAETAVYCCGPEPLLRAVEQLCEQRWPHGALHLERFAPKQLEYLAPNSAFEVKLATSGLTVLVQPDQSILRAVEAAGVQVLSSCTEGTCGTCETTVLAGEVDHRDSLLTDDEQAANDTMMICVSRSRSPRLVLEL